MLVADHGFHNPLDCKGNGIIGRSLFADDLLSGIFDLLVNILLTESVRPRALMTDVAELGQAHAAYGRDPEGGDFTVPVLSENIGMDVAGSNAGLQAQKIFQSGSVEHSPRTDHPFGIKT